MKFLRQHSMKLAAGLVLLALAGWLFLHRAEISRDSVIAYGKGLPAFAFIAAFLRLDHIFVSPHFVVNAIEVPATPTAALASDHLPVGAELTLR